MYKVCIYMRNPRVYIFMHVTVDDDMGKGEKQE